MTEPNVRIGVLSAIGVLFIWSGFIVFSRMGVLAGLTPYDVVAARFLVAGALTVPFAWAWWPRQLPLSQIAVLAVVGPGGIYSILMFTGLGQASAAYGGVFSNGALPIFTIALVLILTGALPKRMEMAASAVIVAGGIMVAWRGLDEGGDNVSQGIALFLCASALIAAYITLLRRWAVSPREALAIVNIPNTLIFLPIWYFFLPSTMAEAEWQMVVGQLAFQGLGPGFLAVMMFAALAYHLGPTPTAAVAATVPATAALLAIPMLGEIPTSLEWSGIALVTAGLVLLIRAR